MEIHIPPKGDRPPIGSKDPAAEPSAEKTGVVIEEVITRNARLMIHPKDKAKAPLHFEIHDVGLESAGKDVAMKYAAVLTNPKPPGEIRSTGVFGPCGRRAE